MKPAIHQLTAGFVRGDAISNEAAAIRNKFRAHGFASDIFSEKRRVPSELRGEVKDLTELKPALSDIVILHLSVGSDVNDVFSSLQCRKVIIYHNITPAEYFRTINPPAAALLDRGRRQLFALRNTAELNLSDSRFNAAEMEAAGYKNVGVLPLMLDRQQINTTPDRHLLREWSDPAPKILFVGRCVPNKKLEDLLRAFYYIRRYAAPQARLIHVGSYNGMERYYHLLLAQAKELGISESVTFMGMVTQPELSAAYASASLFLCMSEHEGFCIPLLEAMHHGVPVMAFAACAVPETMGGAGVLFEKKEYDVLAEMAGKLMFNQQVRASLIASQKKHVENYFTRDVFAELEKHLAPMLD